MIKINFEDLPSEGTPINAANLNQTQTNAENAIAEAKQQLLDEMFFKAGETFSGLRYYTGGFVTTGRTEILFSIPMPKRLDNVTPRITSGKIYIRDVNGNYLKNNDNITDANITIIKDKSWLGLILKYDALTTTNNTPVGVQVADIVINFN